MWMDILIFFATFDWVEHWFLTKLETNNQLSHGAHWLCYFILQAWMQKIDKVYQVCSKVKIAFFVNT